MKVCVIEGCGKKVEARGWCWAHWYRWRRYGQPVLESTCTQCGEAFEPKRATALLCAECRRVRACERAREWAAENPEHVRDRNARHYAANRENRGEAGRRWAAANPEASRAVKRSYYERNREAVLERQRQWEAANPARARANRKATKLARRRRELGADGSHTDAEWIDLCETHGWFCDYCGTELTEQTVTRDHVVPLSRGGTDFIDNLVPCCHPCNSRKHTSTVDEFLARMEVSA